MNNVEFVLYCFIPGSLAFVFNILLIIRTSKYNKIGKLNPSLLKSLRRKKKTTCTLLIVSFAFILMTFPSTIYYLLFYRV